MRKGREYVGCLSGSLTRIGNGLTGEVKRLGNGLKGYMSVVCTSNRDAYLVISKDTLWLTPDMIAENFDIYSNVNWKID